MTNLIGISGYLGSGKDTVGMMIQALTSDSAWAEEPLEYVEAYKGRPNLKGGFQIRKFAAKLKEVASLLTGIPASRFEDQEYKKVLLGSQWDYWAIHSEEDGRELCGFGIFLTAAEVERFIDTFEEENPGSTIVRNVQKHQMTVRQFLQLLGTDAIRDNLHPNTWVNAAFADYNPVGPELDEPLAAGGKLADGIYPNWIFTDMRFPNEMKAIKDRGGVTIRVNRFKSSNDVAGPGGTHLHPSETALDDAKFDYVINNNGSMEELLNGVEAILAHMKT